MTASVMVPSFTFLFSYTLRGFGPGLPFLRARSHFCSPASLSRRWYSILFPIYPISNAETALPIALIYMYIHGCVSYLFSVYLTLESSVNVHQASPPIQQV